MCPDDILYESVLFLSENSRQLIGNGELIEDEEFNLFEEKLSSSNPELTRGLRSWNKKSCYYLGGLGQSCTDVCSQMNDNITGNIDNISGTFTSVYDADSTLLLGSDSTYLGNNAGVSECSSLASNPTAQLFHKIFTSNDYLNIGTVGNGLGCSRIPSTNTLIRIIGDPTTADASETFIQRVCSCKLVHTP
jgi:hypothetical protein